MDAVIFDMDGVIVDSERYWHEWEEMEFSTVVEEEVDTDSLLDEVTGMNYREIYDFLAERYTVTVEKEEWVEAYDRQAQSIYQEKVSLMDGFEQLLDGLERGDVAVGLSSSSPERWIHLVLERFELGERFDVVVSAETVETSKPDPAVYLKTAEELGVEPEDCVAVEDSDNGIEAAERAGMVCIGYRNDSAEADETVASSGELQEALLRRL